MLIIETQRLKLKHLSLDDAEFIYQLYNTKDFHQFIGDRGLKDLSKTQKYLYEVMLPMYQLNGMGMNLIIEKSTGSKVGVCGLIRRKELDCEDLGFGLLPDYYGKGFAFEASEAIINIAKHDLKLKKLLAITSLDNKASMSLLKKLGFQLKNQMSLTKENIVNCFIKHLVKKSTNHQIK